MVNGNIFDNKKMVILPRGVQICPNKYLICPKASKFY